MSWQSLVRGMLAEENPKLNSQLLSDPSDEYEDYVNDVTRRMPESCESANAGVTDPARRATAREVAIAQAREEDRAPGAAGDRLALGRCNGHTARVPRLRPGV